MACLRYAKGVNDVCADDQGNVTLTPADIPGALDKVTSQAGQGITVDGDGVSGSPLTVSVAVSSEAGNRLSFRDGKLFVSA